MEQEKKKTDQPCKEGYQQAGELYASGRIKAAAAGYDGKDIQ